MSDFFLIADRLFGPPTQVLADAWEDLEERQAQRDAAGTPTVEQALKDLDAEEIRLRDILSRPERSRQAHWAARTLLDRVIPSSRAKLTGEREANIRTASREFRSGRE